MDGTPRGTNGSTQVLVFSTEQDSLRVLADSPPLIPGAKLLPDGTFGVNRNMAQSDRRGLLGYILPYPKMDATDQCRVYLGSRPTLVSGPFPVGQYLNQLTPFHISRETLEQMFAAPAPLPNKLDLFFSIVRSSGNEQVFPSLPMLYKPLGPGELDTRPDLPNNQGLLPLIPSETEIDKTVLANGMFATVPQWMHQVVGDLIYLAVGPLERCVTVTTLGDQLIELTSDFLTKLPNTDKVAFVYEIVDPVENGSGWSSPVFVRLRPTEALLVAPVIDQAEPGNPDNLAYESLNGETATVLLNEQFTAGDEVLLRVVLSTVVGDQVERLLPLQVKNSTRSLRIDLENEFIQNGIRSFVSLGYTRMRAGVTHHSKSYTMTISGVDLPAPAPTIDQLVGSELPSNTLEAHVKISTYWPLVSGAVISMHWQVTGANGVVQLYIFQQIINDIREQVVFNIAREYIAKFQGSPLTALYKIENPNKPTVQSKSLQVTIGAGGVLRESFNSYPRQFITLGQRMVLNTMTVTHIEGNGRLGLVPVMEHFLHIEGKMDGQALDIMYSNESPTQRIRLDLNRACSHVSFWYGATNFSTNTVTFYGQGGAPLGTLPLRLNLNSVDQISFAAPGIKSIEFRAMQDEYLVNNFEFVV
ncbi:hypothetical protein [Pseudomonas sp. TWP3-2]|uniref:hypothetical protein n=1 Tax=Pseudomonas sp. TWP3-2 TaxID=2804574 RepID=UPI003CF14A54